MSTTPGHEGQPKILLTAPDGATTEVYLHGAHVTSWKPAGHGEQLFLSSKSEFSHNAAIRGGVPVIFPQFSLLGPLPRHGFVRNSPWEVSHQTAAETTLVFKSTEATLAIWPHPFLAEFTVKVSGKGLQMELRVTNTGTEPFEFASALHTYLGVDDIFKTTVTGLQGLTFRDANTMAEHLEEPASIHFGQEVDRLYYEAQPRTILLKDGSRSLAIRATGFPDAVVWNPGQEKSDKMGDMEAGGWHRFVCVEAAAAHHRISLSGGAHWVGTQVLELV